MGRASRSTKQKAALAASVSTFPTFFTAQDLHRKVHKHGIGNATVYRFLKAARMSGLVHPYACGNHTIYSARKESHCHFVCERTGKVQHFTVDSLGFLEGKIPGKVSSFQIEVRGICTEACDSCEKE